MADLRSAGVSHVPVAATSPSKRACDASVGMARDHAVVGRVGEPAHVMSTTPIADHALLSDRHSSALVDRGRLGRLAVLPALRQPVGVRPAARRRGRPLAGPADRRRGRAPGATSTGRWCWRRRSPTADGHAGAHRRAGARARTTTGTGSARTCRTCWSAGWRAPPARSRSTVEYAPRPEYGLVVPLLARGRRRASPRAAAPSGWCSPPGRARRWPTARPRGTAARCAPGETLHLALHRSTLEQTPARVWSQDELAARAGRTVGGVAVVVGAAPDLRRAVGGPRAPQRPGAAGAVLPAQRRDRRRRRPRRCPRASAASATGTTATPGCATPASPWRRCGWRPARTRPTSSSTS